MVEGTVNTDLIFPSFHRFESKFERLLNRKGSGVRLPFLKADTTSSSGERDRVIQVATPNFRL